jgi:hypothetical protein
MPIQFKTIHHLIRYFLLIGILAFAGFALKWNDAIFFSLIGPPLYLAFHLKQALTSVVPIPSSPTVNNYAFILPITLIYFGLLGFQMKQLWNERGFIRILSLFALILFLLYIHFWCWKNLLGYTTPHVTPLYS